MTNDKLSIVTSLYKSRQYVEEFVHRSAAVASHNFNDFEIILVDDGCPEESWEVAVSLREEYPQIRVIVLSRNFGHAVAMRAGFEAARGDLIFALDSDLEESPEYLTDFYTYLKENSVDLVVGTVIREVGPSLRNVGGWCFYRIVRWLFGVEIPKDQAWMRLMKKVVMSSALQFGDAHIFHAGIFHLCGFRQATFPIKKPFKGTSSYTRVRRFASALDGLIAFSSRPLYLIGVFGMIVLLVGVILSIVAFTNYLAYGTNQGWASIISVLCILIGFQTVSASLIGVYAAKIFEQVKCRPLYLVAKAFG